MQITVDSGKDNMFPREYVDDPELLKWAMTIEMIVNGKSNEGLLGDLATSKANGSFAGDVFPEKIRERFIDDGYIVPSTQNGWYEKAKKIK